MPQPRRGHGGGIGVRTTSLIALLLLLRRRGRAALLGTLGLVHLHPALPLARVLAGAGMSLATTLTGALAAVHPMALHVFGERGGRQEQRSRREQPRCGRCEQRTLLVRHSLSPSVVGG